MMVWGLVNWLVKPSSAASFRCMDFAHEAPAGPDAHSAAPTAAATATYRTDAALGHFAGEEIPALPRPVIAAPPGDAKIAA